MIHRSLFQFLKAEPSLVTEFGDRIYHEWPPQSQTVYPMLSFQKVAGNEFAEDMEAPGDSKMEQANYQFDVWGKTSDDVVGAAETFDSVLRNFRGTMGAVDVQHITLGNESHLGEIIGDKQVRRVSFDFVIYYNLSGA